MCILNLTSFFILFHLAMIWGDTIWMGKEKRGLHRLMFTTTSNNTTTTTTNKQQPTANNPQPTTSKQQPRTRTSKKQATKTVLRIFSPHPFPKHLTLKGCWWTWSCKPSRFNVWVDGCKWMWCHSSFLLTPRGCVEQGWLPCVPVRGGWAVLIGDRSGKIWMKPARKGNVKMQK